VADEQAPDGAVAGVRASGWQWESRTEPSALIGIAVVEICALVAAKVLLRGLAQDALYLVGGFLLLGPVTIVLVSVGIAAGRGWRRQPTRGPRRWRPCSYSGPASACCSGWMLRVPAESRSPSPWFC